MLFHTPKRKAKRVPAGRRKPEPILQKGFGAEMPPQKRLIEIYFDQKGLTAQAEVFYTYYEHASWCSPKGRIQQMALELVYGRFPDLFITCVQGETRDLKVL